MIIKTITKKMLFFVYKINLKLSELSKFYYMYIFKSCGKNLNIFGKIYIKFPQNIDIGDNVSINDGVYINAYYPVKIGNNVAISAGAIIVAAELDPLNIKEKKHIGRPIIVKDNVQIGVGSILLSGSIINQNVIIGAGSVVKKEIQSNTINVGIPAKVLKHI